MAEKSSYKGPIPNFSSVQSYYDTLESRVGYRLLLGGTRHFGYYDPGILWPFPLTPALRRMEDYLYASLDLPEGAKVLDAGCGVGHVAIHLAQVIAILRLPLLFPWFYRDISEMNDADPKPIQKGLHIEAIDITPNHALWAQREIERRGMQDTVHAQWGDYHNLQFDSQSFDGVYTMETLVHSSDPAKAVSEIYRVLKPGGHIVFHEYDHINASEPPPGCPPDLVQALFRINSRSGMPGNQYFARGVLQRIMEEQGFVDITSTDLTDNMRPLMRLFYLIGYLPYLLICLLGLQKWFVNTEGGVQGYRALKMGYWG